LFERIFGKKLSVRDASNRLNWQWGGIVLGMIEKKNNTLSITQQDFLDIAGVMFVALDTSGNVRRKIRLT